MPLRTSSLILAGLLAIAVAGCDDEETTREGGDYSTCDGQVLDNQIITCDELKWGIEDYCGFSLTVDACACAAEIEGCTTDTAWLKAILTCGQSAGECTDYINCLEDVGPSPSDCDPPSDWECLILNNQ